MGLSSISAIGTLAATLALMGAASSGEEAPPARDAQAASAWQTDLAAAMAEARRTKRPLLAVFR